MMLSDGRRDHDDGNYIETGSTLRLVWSWNLAEADLPAIARTAP
jgi:hypothetical protein